VIEFESAEGLLFWAGERGGEMKSVDWRVTLEVSDASECIGRVEGFVCKHDKISWSE
jgi:hypothetical protein